MAKSTKRTTATIPQPTISARASRFQGNMEIVITAIAMIVIFFMVNYIGSKYYTRKDLSPSQYFEISEKTHNVLKNLPGTVNVISIMVNSELRLQVHSLLQEYKNIAGDKLTFEEIDPALDQGGNAEKYARAFNIRGSENVVVFQLKGRSTDPMGRSKVVYENDMVTYASPMDKSITDFRAEQQFTGAIQALIEEKPAIVYFLEGHGERPVSELAGMVMIGNVEERLARENIENRKLSLVGTPKVPDDATALVIAGPQSKLEPDEVSAIGAYLENRGKVLLLVDPGVNTGLEPLLQRYQLALDDDVVKRPTNNGGLSRAIVDHLADHAISRSFRGKSLILVNARSMRLLEGTDGHASPRLTPLMLTMDDNYGEMNATQNPSVYDEGTDRKGPLVVGAAYADGEIPGETQTGTRMVVIGSSTFMVMTSATTAALGVDFFFNSLNWLVHREYSNGITSKKPLTYPMGVTPLQETTINWLALLVVPGITMSLGLFVWYTRRR